MLENQQMQLISEEQDEADRRSISLLGYRDNTTDLLHKNKNLPSFHNP